MSLFNFSCAEEKYVSNLKIDLMQWSPQMDLIAVSTTMGEVHLYRWGWQKVWVRQRLLENESKRPQTVKALAWRPDGRVLAVGYSAGVLRLYSFDQAGKCLYEFVSADKHPIVALRWSEVDEDCSGEEWTKARDFLPLHEDLFQHKTFAYAQLKEIHKFIGEEVPKMEKKFSVLVLVTPTRLMFLLYGMWQMAAFSNTDIARKAFGSRAPNLLLVSCYLSSDLRTANVVARVKSATTEEARSPSSEARQHRVVTFSTAFLAEHRSRLRIIALQLISILHLIKEMQSVNKYLAELWEDSVLDLDSKLTKYNERRTAKDPDYSLKTELMELLLFGHCNEDLREFLVRQWTSKGLKSLGSSIENTYVNLMTYLLRVHHMLVHACLFHLHELYTSSLEERFSEELANCSKPIIGVLYATGAVLAKSQEMQTVIHKGLTNLHAFFAWLNYSILCLAGEEVPADLYTTTADHRKKVVDFINDHLVAIPDKETGKPHFRLERVEQYLQSGELKHPVDSHLWSVEAHPWMEYLDKHALEDHCVYPQYQATLSEVHNDLFEKKLPAVTATIQSNLASKMFDQIIGPCADLKTGKATRHCGFSGAPEEFFCCCFQPRSNRLLVARKDDTSYVEGVLVIDCIPDSILTENDLAIEAVQKYNDQLLCVLVRNVSPERADSALLFLGLDVISGLLRPSDCATEEHAVQLSAVSGSLEIIKDLTKFPSRPVAMAVSGKRNLLCIVFESKQKFRLYMLDPIESEETS